MCLACKPVDEKLRKRVKASRVCSVCKTDMPRDKYSTSQWALGEAGKCTSCTAAASVAAARGKDSQPKKEKLCSACGALRGSGNFTVSQWQQPDSTRKCKDCTCASQATTSKVCVVCQEDKPKECFAKSQWQKPLKIGSTCKDCCRTRLQQSQDDFVNNHTGQHGTGAEESLWARDADKATAVRFIMAADDDVLPSTDLKAYQAAQATMGRADWTALRMQPDSSGISVPDKINYLYQAHLDLCHLRGRAGIVSALKCEGLNWCNISLDASWCVARCEQCRARTTRQCIRPQSRHLPTPGLAGQVVGVDLKRVTPHDTSPRWCMLVCVDFATRRVSAWSLDDGTATVGNVQGVLIRHSQTHPKP